MDEKTPLCPSFLCKICNKPFFSYEREKNGVIKFPEGMRSAQNKLGEHYILCKGCNETK